MTYKNHCFEFLAFEMDTPIPDTSVNGIFPNLDVITNIANDTVAACQARCLQRDPCMFITFEDNPDEAQTDTCTQYDESITAGTQAPLAGTSLSVKVPTNNGKICTHHILNFRSK